jgi:hypothetical protein
MFSSGVHLAITPEHLSEAPPLGVSFIIATCALVVTTLALLLRPASMWPPAAAGLLFAGMIGAYAATRATAIPGISGTPESVDVIGVITKAVEVLGFVLAVSLVLRRLGSAADSGTLEFMPQGRGAQRRRSWAGDAGGHDRAKGRDAPTAARR